MKFLAVLLALAVSAFAQSKKATPAGEAPGPWLLGTIGVGKNADGTVKSARLLDDKRTVLLEIPALKPVMQMSTRYGIKSADGTAVTGEIIHTIHALGE